MTDSMARAIGEMNRRREKQSAYNTEHGITPRTILKSVEEIMRSTAVADAIGGSDLMKRKDAVVLGDDVDQLLAQLEGEMLEAARALEFERAASLRDRIDEVRAAIAQAHGDTPSPPSAPRDNRVSPGREPRKVKRRFGKGGGA
jgi:excinuclease ABC subunit B